MLAERSLHRALNALDAVNGEVLSIAAGTKNGGSKGSGRMKGMHEQLTFWGCATSSLSWRTLNRCSCPCILTIRLDPLKPSVLDAGIGDPHASVRNVFHAEAPRDGRRAEHCNGNSKK